LLTNNPIILSVQQRPYFYEADLNAQCSSFTLSETTSKHCVQVLRMQIGDEIQLTDGHGLLTTASITLAHKKHSQVRILDRTQQQATHSQVIIAIAPTKNMGRIEWALEKLTEIGVSEIILMKTERTERTVVKLERVEQILISAMLQSRQVYLPRLKGLVAFETVLADYQGFSHKWIAHCLDQDSKKSLSPAQKKESHIILIGPEGDFSSREIDLAMAPENQFEPVTLGNTRLRTETAGLVAGVLLKI
jgi:16S rRNA (uracil1498-N3)-methyltransferase